MMKSFDAGYPCAVRGRSFLTWSPLSSLCRYLLLGLWLIGLPFNAIAQCGEGRWEPGQAIAGANGPVHALEWWDPDGDGPQPRCLVIGGAFTIIGNVAADRIAMWNPDTGEWSTLGAGMNGTVKALATTPNGELIAGGSFFQAGGLQTGFVAKWSGSAWEAMGAGFDYFVNSLATLPSGEVVAGGRFGRSGSILTRGIAKWNGTAWGPLGSGVSGSGLGAEVRAVAASPNGDVIVTGSFSHAGNVPASGIARWDGSAWHSLGNGLIQANPLCASLVVMPDGDVVVGGFFAVVDEPTIRNIARWNGTEWHRLGSGFSSDVCSLKVMSDGSLIAGLLGEVYVWDGDAWSRLGTHGPGGSKIHAILERPDGGVVVGGNLRASGSIPIEHLALWDGSHWSALSTGFNDRIKKLLTMRNGEVLALGEFNTAGSIAARRVARWNGSEWLAMDKDASVGSQDGDLAELDDGRILLVSGNQVRWWDGTRWQPFGPAFNGQVRSLLAIPGGQVIAGGNFTEVAGVTVNRVARWDGSVWQPMGGGMDSVVTSLHLRANGEVLAGGAFTAAGDVQASGVARWDGSAWHAIGQGVGPGVEGMVSEPDGAIVAVGSFTQAGGSPAPRVVRWDGAAWQTLDGGTNGSVRTIVRVNANDYVIGGTFSSAGGVPASNIARWNSNGWAALGSGTNATVYSIVRSGPNMLSIGGQFTVVDSGVSAYFAQYSLGVACPADSTGDCMIDYVDLVTFLDAWLTHLGQSAAPGTNGDYDGDGTVDLSDLLDYLTDWNASLGSLCG
ncbi:MAG: hypothetical protein KF768_07420 [Phycisphaeraceae bacterium]|nr:hypothetical protein [Phycisphaeraceae bacterium]